MLYGAFPSNTGKLFACGVLKVLCGGEETSRYFLKEQRKTNLFELSLSKKKTPLNFSLALFKVSIVHPSGLKTERP